MPINIPDDYRPSEDEEFMCPLHLAYFKRKLLIWRDELQRGTADTLANLNSGGINESDPTDRASVETDHAIEFRARDRSRKLVGKIDEALERIKHGAYGYCDETGDPISLKRLEARPTATLCIEAQERHERMEKLHRGD
jgi:DnaK suppressor protein